MTGNESHGHRHADRDVVNAAVQYIRCQTQTGSFVEFDDGHDVWALILYPRIGEKEVRVQRDRSWKHLRPRWRRAVVLHLIDATLCRSGGGLFVPSVVAAVTGYGAGCDGRRREEVWSDGGGAGRAG